MSCNEWKEYTLGDASNIITGFAFKSKDYLEYGKYKVVRGDNVKTGFIYWDEKTRCWDELTERLEKYLLNENDIVIGMDGSRVGKNRAVISKKDLPALLAQRVACIRGNENFSQDYLRYVIMSKKFEDYVESVKTGTSIPHISMKQISEFKFKAPLLEEQEKIANILSSLDDKIELNNEMNKTLEEMAQSIFKRWFVDFEFPSEDGQPYKSSGGEMVDSELGMIPKGWKYGTLDDIANITMGVSPKSSSYNTENIGMPLLNGASDFNGTIINPTKHTTEPKKICKKDDMVFCIRATIGNLTFADKEYCIGRGVASVTPKDEKYREFIYFNINNSIQSLISQATGSVFLNLTKDNINKMKIVIPTKEVLNKFSEITSNIINKVQSNNVENEGLINLRDSLLPKLMSGELKVLK